MEFDLSMDRERPLAGSSDACRSDAELAKRISSGDADAWDLFFDRYSEWAYRFAYYHLNRNNADAEDLCSEILMTAVGSIEKFDVTRGTLDMWLLGIARHHLAQFYRRRRETPMAEVVSTVEDQNQYIRLQDQILTRDVVYRALSELPERQVSVLIEKYSQGCSVEEIARMSGDTTTAVQSLLARARAAFRTALCKLLGGDNSNG